MKKDLLDDEYADLRVVNKYKTSIVFHGLDIIGACFVGLITFLIVEKYDFLNSLVKNSTSLLFSLILFSILIILSFAGLYIYQKYNEIHCEYILDSSTISIEMRNSIYKINYENIELIKLHQHRILRKAANNNTNDLFYTIELKLKIKVRFPFISIPIKRKKIILGPFLNPSSMLNEIKKRSGLSV